MTSDRDAIGGFTVPTTVRRSPAMPQPTPGPQQPVNSEPRETTNRYERALRILLVGLLPADLYAAYQSPEDLDDRHTFPALAARFARLMGEV